jgi:hypothetical protein
LCNDKGEKIEEIKKSAFLWIMTEESQRVSTDRLYRFRNKRQEIAVQRVSSSEDFFVDTALTFGDYVVMKLDDKSILCIVGQIVEFEKNVEKTSKRARNFPFSYCILSVNKEIIVKLAPCFAISRRGGVKTCYEKTCHFDVKSYVRSVKKSAFQFDDVNIDRQVLNRLKIALKDKK